METKIVADNLTNETAATQLRIANVPLRATTKVLNTMKTLTAKVLLVLLAVVSPLLLQAQTTESYTFTTNRVVPDGNAAGLSDVRSVSSAIGTITSLEVRLKIAGEYNGDLYGYLRHDSGFTVLLNRPGKTATDAYGYGDSGFDVTFQTGAANGDIHVYQNVGPLAEGSPLTGTWQPDGRNVDPAVVTDADSRTTSLTNFNSLNAAGSWTLYLVDLESGATNMLTEWGLDVTGEASPTLAWANPADIVYGTALSGTQLNATATYNSTNVPGTFAYNPAAGAVLNAGLDQTLSVTFTPTDTNSFLPISRNVTINVVKAPLTLTADDKTKAYGSADPGFTASYAGFITGEDPTVLLGTLAFGRAPGESAGNYVITASGLTSGNYAISFGAGNLAITQSLSAGMVISSANPALPGADVTFTMTLSAVAPGAGTPTGTVGFRIDGSVAGSGALSGGVATFSTTNLALGSHTVVAEYAGDLNFAGTTNALAQNQIINTPPVAGNDSIERYPTQGVKVRRSTLLANDGDADGDGLILTISTNSANAGTITVSGAWVIYTPAAGFTNADSFTYTIADNRGGSTVGTVTVTIKVDNDPGQNLVITDLGNGSFRISGSGIPGRTYRLQSTATLTLADWQDLAGGSVTADAIGAFEFIDTPGSGMGFYRSVYP
jgi:subtilisin-like proprotein convertase family protein